MRRTVSLQSCRLSSLKGSGNVGMVLMIAKMKAVLFFKGNSLRNYGLVSLTEVCGKVTEGILTKLRPALCPDTGRLRTQLGTINMDLSRAN